MAYEKVACPECGNEYKGLGQHWHHNESHRPELTEYQKEVITGLMMGDGCLNRSYKTPFLMVGMITKEYLEELHEMFGCLSTEVKLARTAKEQADYNKQSDFYANTKEENFNDLWMWNTRSLPELNEFDWYTGDDGEKVWPEDIELTPTVLTHWYVGDGHWNRKNNNIHIAALNEAENTDKIDSYFETSNLSTPSNYATGKGMMDIVFTVEDSHTLWEYMESPPSGFEYKFPEEYR
jgi:hypothetical protein